MRRVSGPLLDRIDLQIEMARVPVAELLTGPPPEDSATVNRRVVAARELALARNGGRPNSQLPGTSLLAVCSLTRAGSNVLAEWAAAKHLSARSVHRLMRVARSIADLDGRLSVNEHDVLAAGSLRDPGAMLGDQLAA